MIKVSVIIPIYGVEQYIERLLLIRPAFSSAEEALQLIPTIKNGTRSY